jgi:DNA polymerase I
MNTPSTKPYTVIFDADMLCFASSSAVEVETDWGNNFWTLHSDCDEAIEHLENSVSTIIDAIKFQLNDYREPQIIMALSDSQNFRKTLLPSYKGNRIGKRKPVCYRGLLQYINDTSDCRQYPMLEGDDVMAILATTMDQTVMVSGDKDLKGIHSINGYLYNHLNHTMSQPTQDEADRWWLTQVLIGDTCDNYSGAKGIGPKTAEKILDAECSWEAVVKAYESKGLTESNALLQARVARILRASDYHDGIIELWSPPGYPRESMSTNGPEKATKEEQ